MEKFMRTFLYHAAFGVFDARHHHKGKRVNNINFLL
jgi:hypothetical protein